MYHYPVRATCFNCGTVEITTHEVHVECQLCVGMSENYIYRFRCPICTVITHRSTDAQTAHTLISAGSSYSTLRVPLELIDTRRASTIPIDHNEVLDFHILLEDDVRLAEIIRDLA